MTQTVQAVFENGVLRPLEPLSLQQNQRVVVQVDTANDLMADIEDRDFLAYCKAERDPSISLDAVRHALAKIQGTLTAACAAERDEG